MVPAAWLVERLMHEPPITSAQLGLLRRGVEGDLAQTHALLGREPRPYTAKGCREAVHGLATPLFGVSVRPVLNPVAMTVTLLLLLVVVMVVMAMA